MSTHSSWNSVAVDLRRAATAKGRLQVGKMVVEGKRLLMRAVRAGYPPRQLLVAESLLTDVRSDAPEVIAAVSGTGCEVFAVPDRELLELSEGRNSGLLVGLCEVPPTERSLEDAPALDLRPILCLVNVDEPGNVGAMMRTALASGARALVSVGGCDPFHPKAIRTSLGSIFTLPLLRLRTIEEALQVTAGMTKLAAVAQEGKAPWDVTIDRPPALFMGNEGAGLPHAVVRVLDEPVTIPMPAGVDSFSVNAAAAVLLYELVRRRATSG
jgi:TrmH family RNA methyltransferase